MTRLDDEMGGEAPCLLPLLDDEGQVPDRPNAYHIHLKRAYDPACAHDGYRVLVDRMWPRGMKRDAARIDLWVRALAPTTELRRWYGHDQTRWTEFRRRYTEELAAPVSHDALLDLAERARQGVVTLVFGARDAAHCNAVVLRDVLIDHLNALSEG